MNRRKKIALATLPAIALVVLGSSVTAADAARPTDLTEEQRNAIHEARELRKEGNTTEARNILRGAGLASRKHHRLEKRMNGSRSRHFGAYGSLGALHRAVAASDYKAFKAAASGFPPAEGVTKEQFDALVTAHHQREDGDIAGARATLEAAGIVRGGLH